VYLFDFFLFYIGFDTKVRDSPPLAAAKSQRIMEA